MSIALLHINAATRAASDVKAGYSDELLIAEYSTFLSVKGPVNNGGAGSTKVIVQAHTFPAGEGFTELRGKIGSPSADGESVGEAGGGVMKYKPKVTIVGDSPTQCEFIENLMLKEVMILAGAPDCEALSGYTQYGGKCSVCVVTKVTFKSGNKNSGGLKEYEVEFETFDKFFYNGTVTKKPQ